MFVSFQAGLGRISKKTAALYETNYEESDDEFFDRTVRAPGISTHGKPSTGYGTTQLYRPNKVNTLSKCSNLILDSVLLFVSLVKMQPLHTTLHPTN